MKKSITYLVQSFLIFIIALVILVFVNNKSSIFKKEGMKDINESVFFSKVYTENIENTGFIYYSDLILKIPAHSPEYSCSLGLSFSSKDEDAIGKMMKHRYNVLSYFKKAMEGNVKKGIVDADSVERIGAAVVLEINDKHSVDKDLKVYIKDMICQ